MQGIKEKKDIKKRNRIRLGDYLYKKRIFTKNEMKKLNLSKLVWIKTKNKKNTKLLQFIREIIIVIFKCISKRFFKTFFSFLLISGGELGRRSIHLSKFRYDQSNVKTQGFD